MLRTIAFLSALALAAPSAPQRYQYFSQRVPRADDGAKLSGKVLPTNYVLQITLEEDFATSLKFSGVVTITLNVTAQIEDPEHLLYAKDLTFTDTLLKKGSVEVEASFDDPEPATDLVKINPVQPLEPGTYTLQITYEGNINTKSMVGIYLSSYVDSFKQQKYVVATQFEDVHARKAFPCLDEPEMKAPFTLTVVYPVGYHAWSNTNAGSPKPSDNLESVRFLQTPPMSTYLLAFLVAEFNCKNGDNTANNKLVELCSRITAFDHTAKLALDNAPKFLDFMGSYVNNNYSIIKMTLAAIPDFAPGAMENWGLITFREADLLWDENESSNTYKQTVVTVLAHELSHQWFGDLVTIEWWSDLFLNEGFATYFEYHAADSVFPDWELPKQFVIEQLHSALESDSLNDVLPLSFQPNSEYSTRTNDVSYSKGGSILRMVRHFLGDDNFKLGLTDYIQTNVQGSVTPELLWNSFDPYLDKLSGSGKPPAKMTTIMENWTTKTGYPILTVKSEGDDLVISQEQFVLSGDTPDTQWYVPITFTVSTDPEGFVNTLTQQWFSPENSITVTGIMKDANWVVLNNQQTGYYRVNYDDNLLKKISNALNSNVSVIDEISRAQIVDDLFNLARAGKKTYKEVFDFLSFLKNDDSYFSWSAAFNGFDYIFRHVSSQAVRNVVGNFVKNHMTTLQASIPDQVDRNDQLLTLKQILTMTWACKLGDQICLNVAKLSFSTYKADSNAKLNPDLRSIFYCNAIRDSSISSGDFRFLWGKYQDTQLATERVTILKALGCVKDAQTRQHYLSMALTEPDIRLQDATNVFSSVYRNNPEGPTEAINFIIDSYKEIIERFDNVGTLKSLILSIADYVTTQDQVDKLERFSNGSLDEDIKNVVKNALVTAKTNVDITKKLESEFRNEFNIKTGGANFHFVNVVCILAGYLLIYIF